MKEKEAIEDLKLQIQRDKEELPYSQECLAYKMVLLNLIQKQEKEINKLNKVIDRIKEYTHQEIVSRSEDIRDYLDDDKEKNKNFIGELKEEREHWKDIERIINLKENEELYMNWWEYGLYE